MDAHPPRLCELRVPPPLILGCWTRQGPTGRQHRHLLLRAIRRTLRRKGEDCECSFNLLDSMIKKNGVKETRPGERGRKHRDKGGAAL